MTTPNETIAKMPKEGDPAPRFILPAHPTGNISLDEFIGKKNIILAFYPKDDTPGCTKEMCAFNDDLSKFNSANTQVLGISTDNLQSHNRFAEKFNLKQPLLSDDKGEVAKRYGTSQEGKTSAARVLFVINKKGMIHKVIEGIPDNNELLKIVQALK